MIIVLFHFLFLVTIYSTGCPEVALSNLECITPCSDISSPLFNNTISPECIHHFAQSSYIGSRCRTSAWNGPEVLDIAKWTLYLNSNENSSSLYPSLCSDFSIQLLCESSYMACSDIQIAKQTCSVYQTLCSPGFACTDYIEDILHQNGLTSTQCCCYFLLCIVLGVCLTKIRTNTPQYLLMTILFAIMTISDLLRLSTLWPTAMVLYLWSMKPTISLSNVCPHFLVLLIQQASALLALPYLQNIRLNMLPSSLLLASLISLFVILLILYFCANYHWKCQMESRIALVTWTISISLILLAWGAIHDPFQWQDAFYFVPALIASILYNHTMQWGHFLHHGYLPPATPDTVKKYTGYVNAPSYLLLPFIITSLFELIISFYYTLNNIYDFIACLPYLLSQVMTIVIFCVFDHSYVRRVVVDFQQLCCAETPGNPKEVTVELQKTRANVVQTATKYLTEFESKQRKAKTPAESASAVDIEKNLDTLLNSIHIEKGDEFSGSETEEMTLAEKDALFKETDELLKGE